MVMPITACFLSLVFIPIASVDGAQQRFAATSLIEEASLPQSSGDVEHKEWSRNLREYLGLEKREVGLRRASHKAVVQKSASDRKLFYAKLEKQMNEEIAKMDRLSPEREKKFATPETQQQESPTDVSATADGAILEGDSEALVREADDMPRLARPAVAEKREDAGVPLAEELEVEADDAANSHILNPKQRREPKLTSTSEVSSEAESKTEKGKDISKVESQTLEDTIAENTRDTDKVDPSAFDDAQLAAAYVEAMKL